MGISGPKERATFTLDPAIKDKLEKQVPKSERSRFVEEAIVGALKEAARQDALKAIREFKRYPLRGPSSTEVLRRIRQEMDGRPIDVLEGWQK